MRLYKYLIDKIMIGWLEELFLLHFAYSSIWANVPSNVELLT